MLKIYIYWHKCWCYRCGTGRTTSEDRATQLLICEPLSFAIWRIPIYLWFRTLYFCPALTLWHILMLLGERWVIWREKSEEFRDLEIHWRVRWETKELHQSMSCGRLSKRICCPGHLPKWLSAAILVQARRYFCMHTSKSARQIHRKETKQEDRSSYLSWRT